MEMYEKQGYTIRNGELYIEELPFSRIAQMVETPVYIFSQSHLEQMLETYKKSFVSDSFDTRVVYASKALNIIRVVQMVNDLQMGLDVVSAGELFTAKKAGFDMSRVVFHGNNKSRKEIEMALEYGVGTIVLDNQYEADLLKKTAADFPQADINALLRVNPGVEAHTHDFIITAHPDSKFGILADNMEEILQIAHTFRDCDQVSFCGFHAHIGSQIFEKEAFIKEIETMADFISRFQKYSYLPIRILDLGGGFASWYTLEDRPIEIEEVCQTIVDGCTKAFKDHNLHIENVWIEPGRSITANSGCTLYKTGAIKQTPHKTYCFVDGGMHENIRPALYQAKYACDLPQKITQDKTMTYTIAGKCCESGDILIEQASLPAIQTDDLLVVYATGAYGYSMASHYNKNFIPGILFVKGDQASWAVRPESLEDLIARECDERVI